jgi:hypothetical protein
MTILKIEGRQLGRVKKIDTKPYSMESKLAGQSYDRFAIGDKVMCVNTLQGFDPKNLLILEYVENEGGGLTWIGDWTYQQEKNLKACLRDAAPASFSELVTL